MHFPLKNKYAIILCGGRGSRLGSITHVIPKSLAQVHGKPILWYIILALYKHGIRRFIFPLGYKGEMIRAFVMQEFQQYGEYRKYDWNFYFFDTGIETKISQRLEKVVHLIPDNEDFLLVNGDTLFDFDLSCMYHLHVRKNALITMSSTEIISNYGILLEKNGKLINFVRNRKISYMASDDDVVDRTRGYINAGLTLIKKKALDLISLKTCTNFENELYSKVTQMGRAAHYKITGNWFAIDTPKDLSTVNSQTKTPQDIGYIMKKIKKDLANRYTYKTRYYYNANEVLEKILNKTIIPHQVEVQPGPMKGDLCWLRCPYCYGNSAKDSGERLSPERYMQVMKQIAEGGINKIVFAGYATDPLNYEYIENLHQITLDYKQIFGFHTKALKISNRLIDQITSPSVAPLSYFSVSVDSGFDETYNVVHGMKESKLKRYSTVLQNVSRVADARKRKKAPLDISITYLINSFNNTEKEIRKAIRDFRSAGVDLIRFTFPQIPRGYINSGKLDPYILCRDKVVDTMNALQPIIREENKQNCQVLLMDLDADFDTHLVSRSLPCFARFIFPCIGFDGWLSHCSETGAPHFRKMNLGNLNEKNFWDLFYDYNSKKFKKYIDTMSLNMNALSCKCDRKEHVVNQGLNLNIEEILNEFI